MPDLQRKLVSAVLSDIGRVRRSNQDTAALCPELRAFVVCDGMGGAAGGEVASELAATTFIDFLRSADQPVTTHGHSSQSFRARLLAATLAANEAVFRCSLENPELSGMGTTLVALLQVAPPVRDRRRFPRTPRPRFLAPPDLFLVNVGDSRCYRWRAGRLLQLSTDHSFVEEQLRAGEITREQAVLSPMRNYITRAVGPSPTVEPDLDSHRSRSGDILLLCTDGLTRELSREAIADLLRASLPAGAPSAADLERAAKALVDAANQQGGHDNTTVLLVACP